MRNLIGLATPGSIISALLDSEFERDFVYCILNIVYSTLAFIHVILLNVILLKIVLTGCIMRTLGVACS